MKRIYLIGILTAGFLTGSSVSAKDNIGQPTRGDNNGNIVAIHKKLASGCEPASAFVDLDINNVRARIMNGGDMWWDLVSTARYEVPKVTEAGQVRRTSLFAGALWIGGFESNNLKLAAMTYRQNGSDFFPGPLDTAYATIDAGDCKNWDKIWEITRDEIDNFKNDPSNGLTEPIKTWPAHGLHGWDARSPYSHYLAPFVDVDGDFKYDPANGDYPDVYGDQALWYIYNDKGNIHSETNADAIGLEIQTMAFAYSTNDEINNMTFYTSTITNRSQTKLDSCYFGQWVDADLGYAFDDYVGVDTVRSLGFDYNGDDNDEGVFGYGTNPPSVGVDFFEGPKDAKGKQIGMKYFVYYNNDFTVTGNPSQPLHYYYYLTGRWKNGDHIKYGQDGFKGNKPANYMFPGDPRKPNEWSEVSAGDKPGDRRFLQSAGAFSLKPGATNKVTVGVVWARTTSGGATGSLDLLKLADDKAQRLYNNKFKLINGPDAPDVTIREMDRKLVLSLENTNTTRVEKYQDTVIDENGNPIAYKFEGYQIYQLKNATVTTSELDNPDKARLIAQVDVKNEVKDLVNRIFDPKVSERIPVKKVEDAENKGIRHTFTVTEDAFATGDKQIVNYKFYYFLVVSYAHALSNNTDESYLAGRRNIQVYTGIPHKNDAEFSGTRLHSDYGDGPELTRIEGSGNGDNIIELTPETEAAILKNNRVLTPTYKGGKGPVTVKVYDPTKLEPGDYELKFTDTVIAKNPANGEFVSMNKPNPPNKKYTPLFRPSAKWILTNKTTGKKIKADTSIIFGNEQLLMFPEKDPVTGNTVKKSWGLAITTTQVLGPGYPYTDEKNGFLEATMTFANESQRWLTGIADQEHNPQFMIGGQPVPTPGNWIRAGKYGSLTNINQLTDDMAIDTAASTTGEYRVWVDPNQDYEDLLGGIIAPAALCVRTATGPGNSLTLGPLPPSTIMPMGLLKLQNLQNVDIVFTPDRSKWSECMVLEMGESKGLNQGNAEKFDLRDHAGWMGEVNADGTPKYSTDPAKKGKSMFPGYAINVETGERLNIFFGEDSHLSDQNGADMIWNPTSVYANPAAGGEDYLGRYLYGGKHWIYVMNSYGGIQNSGIPYDGCQSYWNIINQYKGSSSGLFQKQQVYSSMLWVMEPFLMPGEHLASLQDGIVPNEARIRLRVSKPYTTFNYTGDVNNNQNNNLPYYTFSTSNIIPERTAEVGKQAIDLANVVPNPYYGTSSYETSQLDNRVRFTNLPSKCEIEIYTLNGVLVRKFTKDELSSNALTTNDKYPTTFLDWDLKNQRGVPIASGVYLIHINGFELGEKIIKWFGVTKPIDLDTF